MGASAFQTLNVGLSCLHSIELETTLRISKDRRGIVKPRRFSAYAASDITPTLTPAVDVRPIGEAP
jgi:hypothetical protein